MKHSDHFKNFLDDTVNLPQVQAGDPQGRVDAVYNALKADADLGPSSRRRSPRARGRSDDHQPGQDGNAFDADFMVQMVEDPDWADRPEDVQRRRLRGPAQHIALQGHAARPEVPMCLTSTTPNAMHVDIVPLRGPRRRHARSSSTATTTSGSAPTRGLHRLDEEEGQDRERGTCARSSG